MRPAATVGLILLFTLCIVVLQQIALVQYIDEMKGELLQAIQNSAAQSHGKISGPNKLESFARDSENQRNPSFPKEWYEQPEKAMAWYEDNCQPMVFEGVKGKKLRRDRKWFEKNIPTTDKGSWSLTSCWSVYLLDLPLAKALSELFKGSQVVELGSGCGCYASAMLSMQQVLSVKAFDGVSNIHNLTHGLVESLDLSSPAGTRIPPRDWTLCMEVGEHVPVQFEDMVLDNAAKGTRRGVVLSWAPPGQGGLGHVNERSQEHLIEKMVARGFAYEPRSTAVIRAAATKRMFKKNLLAFVRS